MNSDSEWFLFFEVYWDFLYDPAYNHFFPMFCTCSEKNMYAVIMGYRILYMSSSPILLMGYSNLQYPCRFCLLELSVIERKKMHYKSGIIHPSMLSVWVSV